MKKLSIVLLCALLAFSFVSCEKDKSGDMITNYENFMAGWVGAEKTYDLFYDGLYNITGEVSVDLNGIKVHDTEDFVQNYLGREDIDIDNSTVDFTGGKITGNITSKYNRQLTFADATFKVKYTEGEETAEKELEFTINGTCELSTDEEANTDSAAYNFTANDKTYNISYTQNNNQKRYTSAKVNGNDVEVRLLNALFSLGF